MHQSPVDRFDGAISFLHYSQYCALEDERGQEIILNGTFSFEDLTRIYEAWQKFRQASGEEASPLKPLQEYNDEFGQGREPDENWGKVNDDRPRPTGIACPQCGKELYDSQPRTMLLSWPPKMNVHCPACGHKDYRVVHLVIFRE